MPHDFSSNFPGAETHFWYFAVFPVSELLWIFRLHMTNIVVYGSLQLPVAVVVSSSR